MAGLTPTPTATPTADVVLPCLDEAEALPWVLSRIPAGWRAIVVDNGSRDGSARIAADLGATVVHEPRRGFGAACHAGLLAATEEFVCFCDCDASLDPGLLPGFVREVAEGRADLVLGRRRPVGRGAWPLHARVGNAALARVLRRTSGLRLHDIGPLRAARREALLALPVADRRSGYPLETLLHAAAAGWHVTEHPVPYHPRTGTSKVTGTWRGTFQAVHDMSRALAAAASREGVAPARETGGTVGTPRPAPGAVAAPGGVPSTRGATSPPTAASTHAVTSTALAASPPTTMSRPDRAAPAAGTPAATAPPPAGPTTLLVMAKAPVPGRVKTRLVGVYSPAQAAALAEAALRDTLDAVLAMPARRRVLVLDGEPGDWLPAGVEVVPQAEGGLDERLAAAFAGVSGPALVIGMDTPQVTAEVLRPALAPSAWDEADAWFGPAADGGFWALGLARPDAALLRGVPMSRPDTGRLQRERLVAAGLTVRDLPVLRDVDTPRDADAVAAAAPGTRFAAAVDAARARAEAR